jgi:peptidoglycan hydrolase-like protein with peptidoglycan-binding domain
MPCKINTGNRSDNVKKLQLFLKHLKIYTQRIDSYYGSYTVKAVKSYQRQHGLTVDGFAGCITTQHMQLECAVHNCPGKTSETSNPPIAPPTLPKIMNGTITQIRRNGNKILVSFKDHGTKLEKKTVKVLPAMQRSDAIKQVIIDAGLNPNLNWSGGGMTNYSSLKPPKPKKTGKKGKKKGKDKGKKEKDKKNKTEKKK